MTILQERLPMTLPKIVELVTKKKIPEAQRYLIFEVKTEWLFSVFCSIETQSASCFSTAIHGSSRKFFKMSRIGSGSRSD